MSKRRTTRVERVRIADSKNAVITVLTKGGDKTLHRHEVCEECPWRKDRPCGAFPAEAYRLSATVAHDAGTSTFACHMSGSVKPQTCAGFLLSHNADHNLAVRFAESAGRIDRSKIKKTVETYRTYTDMAVANGVPADDPAIAKCRTR